MRVVKIAIDTLIPYARNARTHSAKQVSQIAASIKEFGWTNPILIKPDKEVIAGHGRLLAAKELGMDKVPCIVLDGLSDSQCRSLVIADNQLALNAGWDIDLLASELQDLKGLDFDLPVIGFTDNELESLMLGLDGHEARERKPVNFKPKYEIIVSCENEQDMEDKYNELIKEGYICKLSTL